MSDDVVQLQRQAARRVQRMQEHSRQVFEQYEGGPLPLDRRPAWSEPRRMASPGLYVRPEESLPAPPSPPPPSVTGSFLGNLDGEQWMLLGLALLLLRSGSGIELPLALFYLAM